MKKRFLVLISMVSVFSLLSVMPAYADTYDLIAANDGGGCMATVSISTQPIAPDVYTMRAQGGANCPGAGQTSVVVCVEMQQPNGDYEASPGGACGAGTSANRATASSEVVCVAGTKYRGTVKATQGSTIGKAKTAGITCPPL
jgi:hypothetical protein